MQIPVNYLKAMLLFCGKKDVRYYLNGIAIKGDKMIATDGWTKHGSLKVVQS